MKDGFTVKLKGTGKPAGFPDFLNEFEVKLVVIAGGASGATYSIEQEIVTVGRGPGVDLAFDDSAMSRQHAAIEYADGGLRVRDLGSTNGIACNDAPVQAAELQHGDRVLIGTHTFQLLVEQRSTEPDTYVINESA